MQKKQKESATVSTHTLTRFEDFWHVLSKKYEFCGAILHEFCKMCAYNIENAAVTGNGVNSKCHPEPTKVKGWLLLCLITYKMQK